MIVIIALALFSFVLTDVIKNGGFGTSQNQNTIATVNGTDIDRVTFNNLVDQQTARIGSGASESQIRNFIWEQEVRKAIIQDQLESLGYTAESNFTKNALTNALQTDPTFFNDAGVFDYAKLEEYVAFQQENQLAYAQWLSTENQIVSSALEQTYFNMVQGSVSPTLIDGEWEYRLENDKVDIQYIQIPYSSIEDDQATVTDAEIEAYMRDHLDQFTIEPRVDIQYVLFPGEPSASDELATTQAIEKLIDDPINSLATASDTEAFVNANSDIPFNDRFLFRAQVPESIVDSIFAREEGGVYGPYREQGYMMATKIEARSTLPDSVKARHILIPIGSNPTDNITRDEAEAKVTADSLLTIIKGDNSKFEDFVTAFSSDTGSIANGGLYDWYSYNRMVPEFRDFTFENAEGDIDVVKSQFGFHIIEILGQKNPQEVVKLATVAKELRPSEQTLRDLFTETTTFQMNAGKSDFSEVAKEGTYGVRPVNAIGELDDNIPGLGSVRTIVSWAFEDGTSIGDVNRFDIGNGFAVVQLVRRNLEKALMSNAEGSAIVTPILRNQKKAKIIRDQLTGTTLEEMAQGQSLVVQSAQSLNRKSPTIAGAGTEPMVVGTAFGLKPAEVSKPIDGKNGVYVVRTTAINLAPDLQDYSAFAEQVRQRIGNQASLQAYSALKKAAEIEDNRKVFY